MVQCMQAKNMTGIRALLGMAICFVHLLECMKHLKNWCKRDSIVLLGQGYTWSNALQHLVWQLNASILKRYQAC